MDAPRSPRPLSIVVPPQQSPRRQTVCWSNGGLPTDATTAKHGSGGPETDSDASHRPPASTRSHRLGLDLPSPSAMRHNVRCTKRRLLQQILVKLNQAEVSDDAEYVAMRARQHELVERVEALSKHIKSFATSLITLGHGSSLIGDATLQIAASRTQSMTYTRNGSVSSSNNQHADIAQRRASAGFGSPSFDSDFSKSMLQLEHQARSLAGVVLTTVVASLEKKLDAMAALKREMDERENYKLDYDSALRKLRATKQHGKAEAIVRRDVKLQTARNTLTAATEATMKKLQHYESTRAVLVYHELRQFRDLQTRFFASCAASFEIREQLGLDDDSSASLGHTGSGVHGFAPASPLRSPRRVSIKK